MYSTGGTMYCRFLYFTWRWVAPEMRSPFKFFRSPVEGSQTMHFNSHTCAWQTVIFMLILWKALNYYCRHVNRKRQKKDSVAIYHVICKVDWGQRKTYFALEESCICHTCVPCSCLLVDLETIKYWSARLLREQNSMKICSKLRGLP